MSKEARGLPFDKKVANLAKSVTLDTGPPDTQVIKDDTVFLGNGEKVKMSLVSQKDLYEDAILKKLQTININLNGVVNSKML